MSARILTSVRAVRGRPGDRAWSWPPAAARRPSQPAVASPRTGRHARRRRRACRRRPRRARPPRPSPTATPAPTPVTRRRAADRAAGQPGRRASPSDRGDDRRPRRPARPQSGFSAASIVWQAPAEGGIPRYMMIFGENQPTAVGPVRSSRYYYIAWAAEWKAVYAHAGGSPQALSTLRAQGNGKLVYNADEFALGRLLPPGQQPVRAAQPVHRRQAARPPRQAARGEGRRLQAGLDSSRPTRRSSCGPVGGRISFAYPTSTIRYDYDRATNTYLRTVSVEGKQKDAATKKRVAPKNVIVMLMRFGPLNDGHPNKHRLEAKVVGSGVAWIATNGRTIKGTWRKKSLTAPTKFYDAAGARGDPDRRPDVHQRHADRDRGQDHQGRSASGSDRRRRAPRRPRHRAGPRPGFAWRSEVSSGRARPRAATAELVPAQGEDDEQRLDDDPPRHLRLPRPAVLEDDRDLGDPRPETARPVGHLDLEDVAAGVDARRTGSTRGSSSARP